MSTNVSNPSSQSAVRTGLTTALQVIRWSVPPEKLIERLVAARLQQKKRESSITKTTTTTNAAPPVDPNRHLPHFLGILPNDSIPDHLNFVFRNVFKVTKGKPEPMLEGLLIPEKHFESSNKIEIVVYNVSETLAREYKMRLTKKTRKRQRKKMNAGKNDTMMDQNLDQVVRVENGGGSNSNVDDIIIIDMVSPNEQEEENAMQVDGLPESAAAAGTTAGKAKSGRVESIPRNFVPSNNDWRPFDSSVGLPTGIIKYNKSTRTNWPLDHPIEQISKSDVTKGTESVELLKGAILGHRTQGSKDEADLDVKLGLSSFADNVESLDKILLEVVKFHRKFKCLHVLMRSCLKKWILKEGQEEEKKLNKKDQREALKVQRRQEKGSGASRPTPTEDSIEMVEEVICLHGEGGEGRKRKRTPSGSDNNTDDMSQSPPIDVDLMENNEENNEVEMVDLTEDTPSTECSLSPIPHATLPTSQRDRLIPVAPPVISQSEENSSASTDKDMRPGCTLWNKRPRLLGRRVTIDSASSQNATFGSTTSQSHQIQSPGITSQGQSHASGTTSQSHATTTTSSSRFNSSSILKLSGSTTPSQLRQHQKLFVCKKLQDTISYKCILSTLSQLLWMSGADKLLGSRSNIKGFFQFVRKAVFLGGLQCELRLNYLMSFLYPVEGKCAWMDEGGIDNDLVRKWLLAKVASWLFQQYILVILRTGFYITELSDTRNRQAFYLRDTWTNVTEKMKFHYLKQSKLILLSHNSSSKQQQQQRTDMIPGKLRFLPKKNDTVRPILQYDSTFNDKRRMKDAKYLLDYMSSKVAPHGIRDTTLLHVKWRTFLAEWKRANYPKLYFVRTDIADAYPSVNLMKLEQVLYACQSEDELYRRHYTRVTRNSSRKTYCFVGSKTDPPPLFIKSRQWIQYSNENGAEPFGQQAALKFIKTALDPYIIHVGKHDYQFRHGLPQGSSLSQYLCNIYYGSMDQQYFTKFLNVAGEFFVRTVDDYFFVTPDPTRAMELYDLMIKGNTVYGFTTNKKKTRTNLFVRSDLNPSDNDDTLHEVIFHGWRFCLLTGHVMRDFSAYAGLDIISTLSFKAKNNETCESFIHQRLLNFTPLRLFPIMLDPAINCRRRIFMNVMQAGLMIAFRFYAMCRTLYPNLNVLTTKSSKSRLLFRSLCACAVRLTRYVLSFRGQYLKDRVYHHCSKDFPCDTGHAEGRHRPKIFQQSSSNVPESSSAANVNSNGCGVTDIELLFVVFHAFIVKLSKHRAVFQTDVQNGLLSFLRYQRKKCQMKIPGVIVEEIISTVGTILPHCFAAMRK